MARWKGIRQPDYIMTKQMEAENVEAVGTQIKVEGALLRPSSGSVPWNGISDGGYSFVHGAAELEAETTQHSPIQTQASVTEEIGEDQKGSNHTSFKTSSAHSVVTIEMARAPGNDELDMTGFTASFDLPARKV